MSIEVHTLWFKNERLWALSIPLTNIEIETLSACRITLTSKVVALSTIFSSEGFVFPLFLMSWVFFILMYSSLKYGIVFHAAKMENPIRGEKCRCCIIELTSCMGE